MPLDPEFDDFVSADTVPAFISETSDKPKFHLLWGDGVRILGQPGGGRVKVRARGSTGWVDATALGGQSLLEFYFIDVGQGDGVLIKTPDFRHIMLDGGYPRRAQPTGKSAADFVDWKFARDYGEDRIVLDAMISSHIDWDHYGGLDDVLDVSQLAELDCAGITVETFYHSGLSHWAKHGDVGAGLGPWERAAGKKWFTRILGDRPSAEAATAGEGPQLRGFWGAFLEKVVAGRREDGAPTEIARLSHKSGWLPGFEQGSAIAIRVLGPIEGEVDGKPALLRLAGSKSQNTNGTSVLLRVDFGASRTLLTGDLNANAHRALLELYEDSEAELASDVAKSCHHGSDDVSFPFLKWVEAACTIISSGDAEGHDHPRPRIVAASGVSGHVSFDGDELVTPLVYSTELARSIQIGATQKVTASAATGDQLFEGDDLRRLRADYAVTSPGALRAERAQRPLAGSKLMHKLIYGLVNIRTDGRKILAATMNEGDGSFAVKSFASRF